MNWAMIQFRIEPSNKLVSVSNQVMGENIFKDKSPWGYKTECKDNYNCIFSLDRELGLKDSEKLNELKQNALKATLIVNEDGKITRIDLKKRP